MPTPRSLAAGRGLPGGRAFVALGIALEASFIAMFVVGGYLDWNPSRLGATANWLADHVVSLGRPLFFGPGGRSSLLAGEAYAGLLLSTLAVYALALRLAVRIGAGERRHLYLVVGFAAVFSLSLLFQPYLASQDIFSYAFYARITALYHQNPYVDVPRDFPFDPLFGAIFWRDQPSNYGPLWTYFSALLAAIAGHDVALTLILLKASVAAVTLAGAPLVWATLGALRPRDRLVGTVLYAWNPLLVVETSGNGHNDVVMAVLLLVAVWLFARGRSSLAVAAVVLAALTKYVAVLLLPFLIVVLLRRAPDHRARVWITLRAGVIIGALVAAFFLPIYRGPSTFQVVSFGSNPLAYINSPLELAFREIRVALGEPRDLANLPLRYRGWWVNTEVPTVLWSKVDDPRAEGVSLPASEPLLVVEPQQGRWFHVYEPRLDRFGYVPAGEVVWSPPPANAATAGTTAAILQDASRRPTAQRANLILRLIATSAFLVVAVRLLWRTRTTADAVGSSLLLLFLSYWLVETWFWPWYLIWALVLAALQPRSRLTYMVIGLSLTTPMLNAQANVEMAPALISLYEYRSLIIFGAPVVAIGLWLERWRASHFGRLRLPGLAARIRHLQAGARAHLTAPRAFGVAVGCCLVLASAVAALASSAAPASAPAPADLASRYKAWQTEYDLGREHLQARRYAQAAADFTRAAEYRPDLLDTYRSRSSAYIQIGKYDEAIADLTRLITAEGATPELLLARGDAYDRQQRFDLAIRDFAAAMAPDPDDPQPHRRLALVYSEEGHLDRAIQEQWTAVTLAPSYAPLYRELGDMYAARGDYEWALALYDRAVAVDPTRAQTYASRASALRLLGRSEDIAPDLRRVLVLTNDVDEKSWAERNLLALTAQTAGQAPAEPQ